MQWHEAGRSPLAVTRSGAPSVQTRLPRTKVSGSAGLESTSPDGDQAAAALKRSPTSITFSDHTLAPTTNLRASTTTFHDILTDQATSKQTPPGRQVSQAYFLILSSAFLSARYTSCLHCRCDPSESRSTTDVHLQPTRHQQFEPSSVRQTQVSRAHLPSNPVSITLSLNSPTQS